MIFRIFIITIFMSSCSTLFNKKRTKSPDDSQRPFLGVEMQTPLVTLDKSVQGYYKGIRLEFVFPQSPAFAAGLQMKDLIVAINDKKIAEYNIRSGEDFTSWLALQKPKDQLNLTLLRDQQIIPVSLILEGRKYSFGDRYNNVKSIDLGSYQDSRKIPAFEALALQEKTKEDTLALKERFALMTEAGDRLRPSAIIDLQKNIFRAPTMTHWIWDQLALTKTEPLTKLSQVALRMNNDSNEKIKTFSGSSSLFQLVDTVKASRALLQKSFDDLSINRFEKILQQAPQLAQQFSEDVYVQRDENKIRRDQNINLVQDLQKVEPTAFTKAFATLSQNINRKKLVNLQREATTLLGNKKSMRVKTTLGDVVISGTDNDSHTPDDSNRKTFLIIDLGGNDDYVNINNAIIDYAGNDTYRSSQSWMMAAGVAQINFIIDIEGKDRYTGISGNFAASLFGISFLWDLQGNDEYRCVKYCFGTAFGGVAALIDENGNDRYESLEFSQGVGIAGGYGFLFDQRGDDHYYSQGARESGYGDAGNFSGWSQGVGIGLRGLISGGLGLIYDGQGADEFESGDFSQGGGYYFGWGLLINDGKENDTYQAARYGQGFTAHYAIGSFIDAGGNDTYNLHHTVGQGMSWDLGITVFEDFSGNDRYKTGIHCLGAASHNGVTFFIDYQGKDFYAGMEMPRSYNLPNDYHSGISLGFFIDQGHDDDHYEKFKNNSEALLPKYQWLIDR